MKKSKFNESQIVAIVKECEADVAVEEILRKHQSRHSLRLEGEVRRGKPGTASSD